MERTPALPKWFRERREPAIASIEARVIAASPFPEEPDDPHYRPSLLVQVGPAQEEPLPGAAALGYATLLFVDWARQSLADPELVLRLRALLPRLRLAVKLGKVGPAALDEHRRGQQERYFHHRDAASYRIELRDDRRDLYVAVKSQPRRGTWTPASTLLAAGTVAPFEALQRLERADQLALLAWLGLAVDHWCDERAAPFPRDRWKAEGPFAPPGGEV